MTTITIRRSGRAYRLAARGHAVGNPAVCAGVSGIVCALAGYLKNLERAGGVELNAFRLESGDAELAARSIEPRGDAAGPPFAMAAVGLMQIAAQYPEYIRVDAD